MAKKGFELNERGIGEILNGDGFAADLSSRMDAIVATAGEGFVASIQKGRVRIQASIITATPKAIRRERKHRILERAVDSGRG